MPLSPTTPTFSPKHQPVLRSYRSSSMAQASSPSSYNNTQNQPSNATAVSNNRFLAARVGSSFTRSQSQKSAAAAASKRQKKGKNLTLGDLKKILRDDKEQKEKLNKASTSATNSNTAQFVQMHASSPSGSFSRSSSSNHNRASFNAANTTASQQLESKSTTAAAASPSGATSTLAPSTPSKNRSASQNVNRRQQRFSPAPLSPAKPPGTPSGKMPRRHLHSQQQQQNTSIRTPSSPATPTHNSSDRFVDEIVGIERELKSRASLGGGSRRRRRRRNADSTTPGTPSTPTNKNGQYTDEPFAEYTQSPSSAAGTKKPSSKDPPVLFDSLDTQQPLKLQYDPSQIRFGAVSGATGAKTLKDFKMMAETCNRAGKHRMEALAHYKLATMYEDSQKATQSINHYRKFLHICQGLKDEIGTSLALNRLGVIFQSLGGNENYKTALEYHIRHWEIADTQSKIVAHINMGLVFQYGSQDYENAGEHYRMAFQYALEIGDKQGESLALNNLGALGKDSGDYVTAQACIERHLLLSENMQDGRSASDAYQQLGMLASQKGNTDNAVKMLNKARQIATIHNDQSKANQIKCSIGIIAGNAKFDEYLKSIAQKLKSGYSYSHQSDAVTAQAASGGELEDVEDNLQDLTLQEEDELTSFGTPMTPHSP